ncbi:MAG: glycosyltransferase family 4 protein [Promethearchaeota archaeon]
MRISHVSPRYFPAISGSEFYIQQISEIFYKKSHKIKVFCSNALDFHAIGSPKGKFIEKKHSKINGVDIVRYPIKFIPGISRFFNNSYLYFKKILKKLNKIHILPYGYLNLLTNGPFTPHLFLQLLRHQTDIIHSICIPFTTNLFALLVGKMKKIPTVCTPFYHFVNPRYHDSTYIKFLNKFDRILTCSQKESFYLIKNGIQKDKVKRIHMGINPKKYLKGNSEKFRARFNLKNDQKLILFCGYKNFEKGAISLLLSIKYVIKRFPKSIFIFIGPSTTAFNRIKKNLGPLRKYIINLGVVPYYAQIKLNAFAAHDVYVMPSRSDAYGIAFLEAWINKKPVIGANVGATPEIIKNKEDGLLVPFHSPIKLANAICCLLRNEQEAQQLGINGYEKIQNYTWDRVASKVERIYQELVQY